MSENAENIEAINDFMHRASPATPAAAIAFNDWVTWYESTKPGMFSFWSDADLDHARNLRNAFNRANAVTAAQKQQVDAVIKGGVSLEQAKGEPDRRNASGDIVELPPGVVHQWWFWPTVALGVGVAGAIVVPSVVKLYLGAK
jgi:hypothetical protein